MPEQKEPDVQADGTSVKEEGALLETELEGVSGGGMPFNGMPSNGIASNGLAFSGLTVNGSPWNGLPANAGLKDASPIKGPKGR